MTRSDLTSLRNAGALPLHYIPDNTIAISVDASFDAGTIPRARWVGTLSAGDKISVDSAADLVNRRPIYPLTAIEFHPDVERHVVAARLEAAGVAAVSGTRLPAHIALIPSDPDAISSLAQDDAVAWVYPARTAALSAAALICEGLVSGAGVVASYATVGEGWDGEGLGSVDLSHYLSVPSKDVPASAQGAEIARALSEWSRHVAVRFTPASAAGLRQSLTILWGPRDHGDYPFEPEVLAHAYYPPPPPDGQEPMAGDIHFNESFEWGVSDPSRYDIFSVALHESGHSLGLGHSSNPNSVMYRLYQGIVSELSEEDIGAVRSLYASAEPFTMPSGWKATAIGPEIEGEATEQDGRFTISASGRAVWGTADELRFVSRTLSGDGDVIARLDSFRSVHQWSRAGVMIRASDDPGAPNAFMLVSGGKGLSYQRRITQGGLSSSTYGGAGTAPQWLWLSRRGNRIDAYAASDGGAWRLVGASTFAMGETVQAGLAVSGHDETLVSTAVFSNVSVAATPPWQGADVGEVGLKGSWTQQETASGTQVRVTGAGADIWGQADAFQFVWQRLSGDGEIVARVASVESIRAWTKAGVMIRESLDPGSPHGLMLVSAARGLAFQRRAQLQAMSAHTSGGSGTAPQWVRLTRRGDVLSAFRSTDGTNWTLVDSETIRMGRDVLAGVVVSSHSKTARARAVFDAVRIK